VGASVRPTELQAFVQLAHRLASLPPEEGTRAATTRTLVELFGADAAVFAALEEGRLELFAWATARARELSALAHAELAAPLERVLAGGAPESVVLGRGEDALAAALLPVASQGRVGSVLVVMHRSATPLSAATIELYEGVATLVAIVRARRRADAELRSSERRYRDIFENAPVAIFRSSLEGQLLAVNAATARMFRYASAEQMVEAVEDAGRQLFPDPAQRQAIIQAATTAKGYVRHDVTYRRKDGTTFAAGLYMRAERDAQGRILFLEGFAEDVDERRQAEDALAAEKQRLAVTLRSIGDGVIATDLEQRVVLLNRVAEELTGWSTEEATGRALADVFPLMDAHTRLPRSSPVAEVLAQGGIVGMATGTVLRARGGAEYVIADSGSPIRDLGGRIIGVVLVFRDVTSQEKTEEELVRAQKLESLSVLAGGIAHDFNNLLTGILGNLSFARSLAPERSETATALAEAEQAALRARDLTQQLLTFSRGGDPVKKRVDLAAVIEESARFACRGSAAACRFELTPPLMAEADAGQVAQVIQNLVLNAVQAMPRGGTVTIGGTRTTLGDANPYAARSGAYVRITIRDHGPGVAPELRQRVFDPFFTTKASGRGLGLAICHSIVRKHDGFIDVSPAPGGGAVFGVYLPAAPERASVAAPPPAPRADGRRPRVLVMDDEEMVRNLVARLLRASGYEVVGAADGHQAVEIYREALRAGERFSAVIMDLTIPGGMGGREAIARLRELDPDVRAVVSSGYSNDPIMASHAEYGFRGVLTKPYVLAELRETLARVTT
jgi:PAS domain S-box-containing protein